MSYRLAYSKLETGVLFGKAEGSLVKTIAVLASTSEAICQRSEMNLATDVWLSTMMERIDECQNSRPFVFFANIIFKNLSLQSNLGIC